MRPRSCRNNAGFTLIELITVIIILGILAAIAVPKYYDMSSKADDAASQQALAEGVVHFNLAFMKYVVDNGTPPPALSDLSGSNYLGLDGVGRVQVGDYRYTYSAGTDTVDISAERTNGSGGWETAVTRTIDWP